MPIHHERIELPSQQSFRLMRWRESVSSVEVCTDPGRGVRLAGAGEHWHSHSATELTLVLNGSGTRFVGDSIGRVHAPELTLIGGNVPHYWRGLRGSSGYTIQFQFDTSHAFWQFPEMSMLTDLWALSARGILFSGETRDRAMALVCRMSDVDYVARLALFIETIGVLGRAPPGQQRLLCDKPLVLTTNDPHRKAIQKAIHLIVDHFREDLTLEDIFQAVYMSRPTFCRAFKRQTGRSFVEFLNEVRIDHCRRLLVETTLPIGKVAGDSGFNNLSYFNRVFLRCVGMTPSVYRKSH